MGFRITVIASLLYLLVIGNMMAQPNKNGVPIVTNYEHFITNGSEQNWCITQDHRGIIYVGNNNKGVLEYDGVEWRRIPVPRDPIIRSLVTGDNGVVYVGAVSEFGYLMPDKQGDMRYHSLSDTLNQEKYPFGDVWRSYFHQDKVYFCTYNFIFLYDIAKDILTKISTPEYTFFSFLIDGVLYSSSYGKGLMRYEKGEFVMVKGGRFFKEKSITGLVPYDETSLLAGTFGNGVFLFDIRNGVIDESFIEKELDAYFRTGNVTNIRRLEDSFVVSGFNGVVILNRDGEASEIISEKENLIDKNVPNVYYNDRMEHTSPLWIANYLGVSKLEPTNPFRVFTESSGIEDFVNDIILFNETLFIATFNGLYYKSSDPTGTRFIPLAGTEGTVIRHLMVFKPSRNREFLIASSEAKTYVIDPWKNLSELKELISNPPENLPEQEEYAGRFAVQDPDDQALFYTGRIHVVGVEYYRGRWTEKSRIRELRDEILLNKVIDKYGFLWTSSDKWVVRIDINEKNDPSRKFFLRESGLPSDENNRVFLDPDTREVLIGTTNGFYRYNYYSDAMYCDTIHNPILPPGENLVMAFYQDHDGDYWYSFENEELGWTELVARKKGTGLQIIHDKAFQRLASTSTDVIYSSNEKEVWFGKSDRLYHFNKSHVRNDSLPFHTLIRRVSLNTDSLIFNGSHYSGQNRPQIKYRLNNVGFWWAAPFFEQEEEILFSYKLEGFGETWSEWEGTPFKEFTNLPYGSYNLHVKARNVYGKESLPATYSFTILRPWYAHFLAYLIYILMAGVVIYVIIKLYTRRLKKENLRLEGIIQERTAEIRKQKEELTDSIEYASRIQRALLPSDRLLDEHSIEHFILFRPRDIVSGDFYWIGSKNNKLLIVAADCTGHGVPGAFMSMLGMTFLDEIVIKSELTSTDEILGQLRDHVITSLKQSGQIDDDSTKDGMDLAMISIDLQKRDFQFSGAYNPIYLVRKLKRSEKAKLDRDEELDLPRGSIHNDKYLLLQIRADQMPIGISEKTLPFHASTFKDEGYNIYMFSDGFLDQFGGPRGKKFMSRNFKKLILELQSVPLRDQGAAMEKVLTGWMGEISQIDDILVMGLRLNQN
ncbi:MAG: SpoIIE family protein phosphatase [Bacteroidota bacterium]